MVWNVFRTPSMWICIPSKSRAKQVIHVKDSLSYQWAKFGRLGLPGCTLLVGGFNPLETYACQIGSFPQVGVKNKKHLKPPLRLYRCTGTANCHQDVEIDQRLMVSHHESCRMAITGGENRWLRLKWANEKTAKSTRLFVEVEMWQHLTFIFTYVHFKEESC